MAELEPRVDELDVGELAELEQAGRLAHGEYTTAAYALRDKVRTRREALTTAAVVGPGDDDSEQDRPAAVAIDSAGADEERDVDVDVDEVLAPGGDAE